MKINFFKNFPYINNLKYRIIFQSIISFINSLLELINLSLLPFIIIILLKDRSEQIELPLIGNNFLINLNSFVILVITVFLIKSSFNFFVLFQQEKLYFYYCKSLSLNFLKNFFKTSYYYQSTKTFAELNKIFISDIPRSSNHLRQIIIFNREILLLIMVILILFYRNFYFSLTISLFLFLVFLFYIFLIKNLINKWTKKNSEIRSGYFKLLTNTLNFLPDIKVFKLSKNILEKFNQRATTLFNLDFKVNLITNSARIYFEIIIFISIILIILFILYAKFNVNDEIIRDLTFLVLASIRLIPTLSLLNSSLNNIKYYGNSTKTLANKFADFKLNFENKEILHEFKKLNNGNVIVADSISFKYGKKKIFENLNFNITKNNIFLIDGPSGAGKSTLLKVLIGVFSTSSGKVFLNSEFKNTKNIFSYVPQDFFLLDDNIVNNIILDADFDFDRFKKAIKVAKVSEFFNINSLNQTQQNNNENYFEKSIKLSGGQRQRISIARALYREPKILFLDEATNQIDSELQSTILNEIINTYDITIILISHDKKIKKMASSSISLN